MSYESAEDDDESLEEAAELTKVAAPKNAEGHEVGKGPSFATNTQSITKGQGPLKGTDAKANMSTGGETSGHKPISNPKGVTPKDMGNPDNTVSSGNKVRKQKAKAPKPVEGGEVGSGGKNRGVDRKSIISKKVR